MAGKHGKRDKSHGRRSDQQEATDLMNQAAMQAAMMQPMMYMPGMMPPFMPPMMDPMMMGMMPQVAGMQGFPAVSSNQNSPIDKALPSSPPTAPKAPGTPAKHWATPDPNKSREEQAVDEAAQALAIVHQRYAVANSTFQHALAHKQMTDGYAQQVIGAHSRGRDETEEQARQSVANLQSIAAQQAEADNAFLQSKELLEAEQKEYERATRAHQNALKKQQQIAIQANIQKHVEKKQKEKEDKEDKPTNTAPTFLEPAPAEQPPPVSVPSAPVVVKNMSVEEIIEAKKKELLAQQEEKNSGKEASQFLASSIAAAKTTVPQKENKPADNTPKKTTEEKTAERAKAVGKAFDIWKPPPHNQIIKKEAFADIKNLKAAPGEPFKGAKNMERFMKLSGEIPFKKARSPTPESPKPKASHSKEPSRSRSKSKPSRSRSRSNRKDSRERSSSVKRTYGKGKSRKGWGRGQRNTGMRGFRDRHSRSRSDSRRSKRRRRRSHSSSSSSRSRSSHKRSHSSRRRTTRTRKRSRSMSSSRSRSQSPRSKSTPSKRPLKQKPTPPSPALKPISFITTAPKAKSAPTASGSSGFFGKELEQREYDFGRSDFHMQFDPQTEQEIIAHINQAINSQGGFHALTKKERDIISRTIREKMEEEQKRKEHPPPAEHIPERYQPKSRSISPYRPPQKRSPSSARSPPARKVPRLLTPSPVEAPKSVSSMASARSTNTTPSKIETPPKVESPKRKLPQDEVSVCDDVLEDVEMLEESPLRESTPPKCKDAGLNTLRLLNKVAKQAETFIAPESDPAIAFLNKIREGFKKRLKISGHNLSLFPEVN